MSAVLTTQQPQHNALVEQPANEIFGSGNAAMMLSPATMKTMLDFAEQMARGNVTVPQHLRKSPADCLAVVMQAIQWGMNPFAVAQKTHVVNGALGYEAQLVNAVLQQNRAIEGRFHYEYQGDGNTLKCRVGAVPWGEKEVVWGEWLGVADVTIKNSPLWKTNPKQQLGYLQVKNWARLYKPGAILGVYTADELEDNPPPALREMGAADVVDPPSSRTEKVSSLLGGNKEEKEPPAPKLDDVLRALKAAATPDDMRKCSEQITRMPAGPDKDTARNGYQSRMKELRAAADGDKKGDTGEAGQGAGAADPSGAPVTYASVTEQINQTEHMTADREDYLRGLAKRVPDETQQIELFDAISARKEQLRA